MGNPQQPLATLVACTSSEGDSPSHSNPTEVLWSACAPAPSLSTKSCTCTGTANGGLLWAAATQSTIASLPPAIGGTIAFADGRTPTTMSLTTITASRDGVATTMVVPAAFSAAATAMSSSSTAAASGLSSGAQAGIGIGAAAVGLATVGMGVVWFVWRQQARAR